MPSLVLWEQYGITNPPPLPSPCLPTHTPLLPPPVAPNTYSHVFACSRSELRNDPFFFFCMIFPSLPVLIQLTGCCLKQRHSHNSAGFKVVRRRVKMLHLLTDNGQSISRLFFHPGFSLPRCWMALWLTDLCSHLQQLPVLFERTLYILLIRVVY